MKMNHCQKFNDLENGQQTQIKKPISTILWDCLPISVASLEAYCFGLMLGWPSPMYQKLLIKNTSVSITFEQTAPLAGFLMFGVIFATPLSKWSPAGNKYGLIFGVLLILIGWVVMFLARTNLWLFASRLVVGLGHGYGLGQLKLYVVAMSEGEMVKTFTKLISLYVFLGTITAFIVGPFVTFWTYSLVSICLTASVLILLFLLPKKPLKLRRFLRNDKYLKPQNDSLLDSTKNFECNTPAPVQMSLFEICRNWQLVKKTFLFFLLTFFQQYTSIPPLTVYTQIVFETLGYPSPHILAALFIVFLSTITLFFYFKMTEMNSKILLTYSSILLSCSLWFLVFTLHNNLETKFPFICLFILLFIVYCHAFGLGTVPFKIVGTFFPAEVRSIEEMIFIMCYSFFALSSTKIFQVLLSLFGLKYCFIFNAVIATISIAFTVLVLPDELD
ncbi:sugar transporter ERD6-like 7 [Agrilus planipennis]|uniref:Sugar transporter ERD6-like 7 n=1 Tax=Agrilus planipennis TaxID=224129 RepID=A0A1W4WY80_AGRPL|nr:sugar transporter ERD6-like 7 [Agrilus planipennis]XP_018325471.1 sugar transporter ERD6-like 7 [Agrilus planipennis]XP_018325472.1 sugar transporter ERD6-like 7 [Agrilus planipennis]XP_018325473.1 sugar transporter ERD6-like 7 [Agrilus planipennis]